MIGAAGEPEGHQPMQDSSRHRVNTTQIERVVLCGIMVAYACLVLASSRTKLPINDEGWYGQPAFRLAAGESMGTPALENVGVPRFHGIEQHTYWIMPLFIVAQASVYKVIGAGLFQMRFLSATCGALLILSWYAILRVLFEDVWIPALGAAILAVDIQITIVCSTGRSDAMCAALGSAALAVYLWQRKYSVGQAVALSQSLVVASGLTHPYGIYYFIALVFVALHFDRKALTWRHFVVALIPYVIGAALWGAYILRAPGDFAAQFGSNASERAWVLSMPLRAVATEAIRYRDAYGFGVVPNGAKHLEILILAAYVSGMAGVVFTQSLRQSREVRLLLILAGLFFLDLVYLEGAKASWYLIHIIPCWAALLAIWVRHAFRTSGLPRRVAIVGFGGFLLLNVMLSGSLVHRDNYGRRFEGMISFLRQTPSSGKVMGGTQLGFGLGFDRIKDDYKLGYYSGLRPQWIVIDGGYRAQFQQFRQVQPDIWRHIEHRLGSEYLPVFDNGYYTVYQVAQTVPRV